MATNVVQKFSAAPLEKYILKDGIGGGPDFPVVEVPVIDLTLLTSLSLHGENELEKLRLAFTSCGYIQVVNHGIEDSFLDQVHGVSKGFFSLPIQEKMKCAGQPKDGVDGFGKDTVYSENEVLCWNDRLYLSVQPESQRKLELWPQNPKDFRKILLDFTAELEKMNKVLQRAMAKSLKLEDENCFLKQCGEKPTVLSRFNFYPPCPRPDAVLAAKVHNDASALTYLLQDKDVEGLQTLKNGEWCRVPIIPNAIVVNIGDQFEIMSNGIFKSPVHRVVTNPHKERITLAVFFNPEPTSEIGPAAGLIDESSPRLFKSVVDYIGYYFQSLDSLPTGKMPIDLLKV